MNPDEMAFKFLDDNNANPFTIPYFPLRKADLIEKAIYMALKEQQILDSLSLKLYIDERNKEELEFLEKHRWINYKEDILVVKRAIQERIKQLKQGGPA